MAKIYNAPKPKFSFWERFKFIAIRTIFPPVLLWDLVKLGANKLLGAFVGSLVLPAQNMEFYHLKVDEKTFCKHDHLDLIGEKHEIITHDDAHLDTFEVKHTSQEHLAPQYQKYIINLVANAMCYEQIIEDMKKDAKALNAHVVGFNFRGVGCSTGKAESKEDLVTDGIAQVQRLLDQGVSPQNITLKGHSLGAGIATLVAQHFHQLEQPINLFNSRSFSTITNVLVAQIRLNDQRGHKDSTIGIIGGWLLYPFIKFGVSLTKWEINAGSAFKSIPEAYRDYIVVRSPKNIRADCIDDPVIPHYASIHKALTSERRKRKAEIDKKIKNTEDSSEKEALLLLKQREKDRKMVTEDGYAYANGHNLPLDFLCNRARNKSAYTFFTEFVQRAEIDHGVKIASLVN